MFNEIGVANGLVLLKVLKSPTVVVAPLSMRHLIFSPFIVRITMRSPEFVVLSENFQHPLGLVNYCLIV